MADNTQRHLNLVSDEGQVETEGKEPIECRNFFNINKPGSVEGRIQNTQTNPEAQTTTLEITVGKIDVQNKEDQEKVFFKEGDVLKIILRNKNRSMIFSCDHGENHAEGDIPPYRLQEIMRNLSDDEQAKTAENLGIDLKELEEKGEYAFTSEELNISRRLRRFIAQLFKNNPEKIEAANNMDFYNPTALKSGTNG